MVWKQRGESAKSSDESTQTVLKASLPGPTALFFVPLFGGGAGSALFGIYQALSGDPGPGCVLKGAGEAAARQACTSVGDFSRLPRAAPPQLLAEALSFFSLFPERNGRDLSKH